MMDDIGEMFDGTLSSAKGVLIGGGLAQATILGVKILMPAKSKYAGLIGAGVGGAISAFMMSKPQHREAGQQGLAAALLIGLSRAVEDLALKSMIKDSEFGDMGAYTSEMGAVPGVDIQGPLEIMDAGAGSSGLLGAITSEMGDDMQIQGAAFGATGF
jgi:hypothetical protein